MISIYVLSDPRTHEIRYVGLTSQRLEKRLREHISDVRTGVGPHTYRYRWMSQLLRQGYYPVMTEVASYMSMTHARQAEKYWINYFRDIGCKLTNLAGGGEGTGSRSEEGRLAHLEAAKKRRGQKRSPEARQRMSEAAMGRKRSPEWRARQSDRMKGHVHPEEVKEKMRQARLGGTVYDDELILRLNEEGKSLGTAVRATGASYNYVRRLLQRNNRSW